MLGWEIYIHRLDSDQSLEATKLTQDSIVAHWRAGLGGYDWIKELVKIDKAKALGGNGYPFLFSAKFHVLHSSILDGPTLYQGSMVLGDDYLLPKNYLENLTINEANFSKCKANDELYVQVWDMG